MRSMERRGMIRAITKYIHTDLPTIKGITTVYTEIRNVKNLVSILPVSKLSLCSWQPIRFLFSSTWREIMNFTAGRKKVGRESPYQLNKCSSPTTKAQSSVLAHTAKHTP